MSLDLMLEKTQGLFIAGTNNGKICPEKSHPVLYAGSSTNAEFLDLVKSEIMDSKSEVAGIVYSLNGNTYNIYLYGPRSEEAKEAVKHSLRAGKMPQKTINCWRRTRPTKSKLEIYETALLFEVLPNQTPGPGEPYILERDLAA